MVPTEIKKKLYHLKHKYWNFNNIVLVVALLLASSWVWGAITTMQRNFVLQKDIEARKRQVELTRLEVATLEYQQNYYRSDEYRELAARERLGLALPGEKVLVLPPNSPQAERSFNQNAAKTTESDTSFNESSNLAQWLNFFSGKNVMRLEDRPDAK